uniref:Uncharacterized protein n=1 Tax=Anguilla anguilla TaxID=7936 RepID=A0A0E9W7Y8_ANGAN
MHQSLNQACGSRVRFKVSLVRGWSAFCRSVLESWKRILVTVSPVQCAIMPSSLGA